MDTEDHIQGGAIGLLSKGFYIIDIMNKIGYDVTLIGNLEFGYGIDKLISLYLINYMLLLLSLISCFTYLFHA